MRASLLQKGQKQALNKETQPSSALQAAGKYIFCIAKWDAEKNNIIWQWETVTKFIHTLYYDDDQQQQQQRHYLNHKLVGAFVGSQDAIIKFLERKNLHSKQFQPKDFLHVKQEGIYLLKISDNQSFVIVWPGQEYYLQILQTQKLVNLSFNIAGRAILLLGVSDENDIFELHDRGFYHQNLQREYQNQQKVLSNLQDVKIFPSGLILTKQNVPQFEMCGSSAEVCQFLQKVHKTKPCVQFGEAFWKPIRNCANLDEPKYEGQMMILWNLLPQLARKLHETMMQGPQSLIEQLIKKIEQKCQNQSDKLFEIVDAHYDEQNQVPKIKISEIQNFYYSAFRLHPLVFKKFALDMNVLEVFWIDETFFMMVEYDNQTVLLESGNKIWKDKNIYEFVVFQAQHKILVLYSSRNKALTVLRINLSGLLSQSYNIKQEKSLNNILVQYLAQLVDQVQSIQLMSDEQGKLQIFLQSSIEVVKCNLFQRSSLEIQKKPQQVNSVLLSSPEADICLKIYYEEQNWHIDLLSLKPFNLEIIQKIKNINPLKDFQVQNTSFGTYYDDGDDKQYLVVVTHNRAYDFTFIQFEIKQLKKYQPSLNAIPWESFQQNQLFLAIEQKGLKKFIPKQLGQYFCNQWDQYNLEQFQILNGAIQRIMLNYTPQFLPVQQVEGGQCNITQEELQKGDTIWYCTTDQIWIESEVLAQDYFNKTYAVKKPEGEEIAYADSIRRRYSKYVQSSGNYAGIVSAFSAYSELISFSLNVPNVQQEKVLSEVVTTFNEATLRYNAGLLPYDCLPYLYEPFRKVTFSKDQRNLEQMQEMLDCFPTFLNLNSIQPIFQPAAEHLEMILKVFVLFISEKYREAQKIIEETQVQQNFDISKKIVGDCLQLINKTKIFFQQNGNQTVIAEVINKNYTEVLVAESKIKNYLQEIEQKQRDQFVIVENLGIGPRDDDVDDQSYIPKNEVQNNLEKDEQLAPGEGKKDESLLLSSKEFTNSSSQDILEQQQAAIKTIDVIQGQNFAQSELQQPQPIQLQQTSEENTQQNNQKISQNKINILQQQQPQPIQQQQTLEENTHQNNQKISKNQINILEHEQVSYEWQQQKLQPEIRPKISSISQKDEDKPTTVQQQLTQTPQSHPLKEKEEEEEEEDYVEIQGKRYFIFQGKKYPCVADNNYSGESEEYEFKKEGSQCRWRRKNEQQYWKDLSFFPKWNNIL